MFIKYFKHCYDTSYGAIGIYLIYLFNCFNAKA